MSECHTNVIIEKRLADSLLKTQAFTSSTAEPSEFNEPALDVKYLTGRKFLLALEAATRGGPYSLEDFLRLKKHEIYFRLEMMEDQEVLPVSSAELLPANTALNGLNIVTDENNFFVRMVGDFPSRLMYNARIYDRINSSHNITVRSMYSALGYSVYSHGYPHCGEHIDRLLTESGLETARKFAEKCKEMGIELPEISAGSISFPASIGQFLKGTADERYFNRDLSVAPLQWGDERFYRTVPPNRSLVTAASK